MEAVQQKFDLQTESFSEREKFLIARLKEYWTIDRDIREAEKHARGEDLPIEPSITASSRAIDDDPIVRRILNHDVLPDGAKRVVETVQKYVSPERFTYAAMYRVHRDMNGLVPEREDEEHIKMVLKLLSERLGEPEEYLELTGTERLAIRREALIMAARERLPILETRKRIIGQALDDLKRYYPEWWAILWYKYVERKNWIKVCTLAARDGEPLTEDQYLYSRKQALQMFDKWATGLV